MGQGTEPETHSGRIHSGWKELCMCTQAGGAREQGQVLKMKGDTASTCEYPWEVFRAETCTRNPRPELLGPSGQAQTGPQLTLIPTEENGR